MAKKGLIYIATDSVLNRSYIGQTTDTLENRKFQHYVRAFDNTATDSQCGIFYKMIRFLGKEKFSWSILEDNIDEGDLDEKEIFYIKKFDSFLNGYNSSPGGKKKSYLRLNEDLADQIRNAIINEKDVSLNKIAFRFHISHQIVTEINIGKRWKNPLLNYPLRSHSKKIENSVVLEILERIKTTSDSLSLISKEFGVSLSTVCAINQGTEKYSFSGEIYPIRKIESKNEKRNKTKKVLKDIIKELQFSDKKFSEIADSFDINRRRISDINNGLVYINEIKELIPDITFPIRKKIN